MDEDPLNTFFSPKDASDPHILYKTLQLTPPPPTSSSSSGAGASASASGAVSAEDIRKSYRRLALKYHPDKHASKSEAEKEKMSREFQKVGFAYAVLGDEAKRKRYDATGRTDDKFADAEEMGWDAYFESLFQRIDRKVLDDDKKRYQGSQDELDDLISAYTAHSGSLPKILNHIPHSQHSDEPRLVSAINELISSGKLESTPTWSKTSTDEKARAKRGKAAEKSAKEAEEAAKELGVWEEFYGSGAKGRRRGADGEAGKGKSDGKDKGKGKGKGKGNGEETGESNGEDALAALISKRQKERENGLDRLAEKYAKIEEEARARKKGKKRTSKGADKDDHDVEEAPHPDISDADFEALQAKLFGDKARAGKKAKA